MFERFTREARAVVVRAHAEATALGHDHVGTEHLLLALAGGDEPPPAIGVPHAALRAAVAALHRDGAEGLDGAALASIGIDLEEVRRNVEESFGPGALARRRAPRGRLRAAAQGPFTPRARAALEQSLREAVALRHRHIGARHVLLGVVRDPASGAAAALRLSGTSAQAVRGAALADLQAAA
jgi:ATP-dependent Clp protease ATP-binding subunit ClpA